MNRKACSHFVELWKQKHETGQWIEVEPEAMSTRSEFPPFNASGIVFMGDNMKAGESGGHDGPFIAVTTAHGRAETWAIDQNVPKPKQSCF